MPQQPEVGFVLRWRSKFLDFADLANRVFPLLVLHWYLRGGYSDVLTHQIISGESDAWLHGLFLYALHVMALTATIWRPHTLLGFNMVSIMLIYSNLPVLEESRQKLAGAVGVSGKESIHIPSAYDPTIEASYRAFLQVFVGFAVMSFPTVSFLFSTGFSPVRLLALGPVMSTILPAVFSKLFLTPLLSLLLSALTAFSPFHVLALSPVISTIASFSKNYTLLFSSVALGAFIRIVCSDTRLKDLMDFYWACHEDLQIYYAHLRQVCERLERLRLSRFFTLVFMLHMIEVVVRTSAGAHFDSASATWLTFGEELLRRSCDTTISLIGFACVSITAIKYAMKGVRYVLGLQCPGEDLKDEIFLLFFSLALFAKVPLTNHSAGLDCLVRFLHFYVMCWMRCLLRTVRRQLRSYCEDIQSFSSIRKLRILSAICLIAFSIRLLWILSSEAFADSFALFSILRSFHCVEFSGAALSLISMLEILLRNDAHPAHDPVNGALLDLRIRVITFDFVMHCLLSTCVLDSEIFFGLNMRIYTYGYLKSQAEMYRMLEIQRKRAAVLAIEFREATSEELAREDHTCSICYEEMNSAAATVCSHIFHLDCLREWMKRQLHCPKCRRTISLERS